MIFSGPIGVICINCELLLRDRRSISILFTFPHGFAIVNYNLILFQSPSTARSHFWRFLSYRTGDIRFLVSFFSRYRESRKAALCFLHRVRDFRRINPEVCPRQGITLNWRFLSAKPHTSSSFEERALATRMRGRQVARSAILKRLYAPSKR